MSPRDYRRLTRFCTCRIANAQELSDELVHLLMIMVRQSQHQLLIEEVSVRILWIVDDERSSETIRILSIDMRVVPVCPSLGDLGGGQLCVRSSIREEHHTLKSYVKEDPGGTGHCVALATPSIWVVPFMYRP